MSMFPRRNTTTVTPQATGYSVIDGQMHVRGDVETEGSLRIDGRLDGSILRADMVVIGTGASVVGDITAREVIIGGSVTGNVAATQRVELQSTGGVAGDIEAAAVMIQEGGRVQGRLSIHPIALDDRGAPLPAHGEPPRLRAVHGDAD